MILKQRQVRPAQKGIALVTVTIFSVVMIIIAGAILTLSRGYYQTTAHQLKHTKAFYLANNNPTS